MKRKKLSIIAVACSIVVAFTCWLVPSEKVEAADFEGNEEYWTQTCSQYSTDTNTINTCNEYRDYLSKKTNDMLNQSADAQKQIDAMQGDLTKLGDLAYEYEQQVSDVQSQITTVTQAIEKMNGSIKIVEDKIVVQQEKVDARKEVIKDRMVDIQYSINNNEYVDFIMGAESLVDFVQRSESIGTITDYDNQQLDLLDDELEKLDSDKKELVRIQDTKKAQQDVLEAQKQDLEVKQEESKQVLAALEQQQNDLLATKNAATNAANNFAALQPSTPVYIPPTGGGDPGELNWTRDFYSGFYTSPYNIISNVNLTGQCTWYCFGRASEVNGAQLRSMLPTGNAADWYWQAASRGLAVGPTPRTNAIIVWGSNVFGHVAFIESYNNGMITISEGNVNAPGGGLGYGTSLETAIAYTRTTTLSYDALMAMRGAPVGFIYF